MSMLTNYEPKRVFEYFEQICAIPHGSGNTQAMTRFCMDFARRHGLACRTDAVGNVVIVKPAAPGRENEPALMLQAHLDMVCQKEPDCDFDFERDSLRLAIDGDWIYAEGTTLGGDDGIGVALILAILADETMSHPRLEAVFTTEEETGMDGARELDVSDLQARELLNLDSEEEGVLTVSCAGGIVAKAILPVRREQTDAALLRVHIDGLQGGHSGVEIDKGRVNASTLMARLLDVLLDCAPLRLVKLAGGDKDNAICRDCMVELAVMPEQIPGLTRTVEQWTQVFCREYAATEPELTIHVEDCGSGSVEAVCAEHSRQIICALVNAPQGVMVMSPQIEGLVQTSVNLGILELTPTQLEASYSIRSSMESQKQMLVRRLTRLFTELGGHIQTSSDYPGWAYLPESRLRDRLAAAYQELFVAAPQIAAIHAGLECGFFAGKIPGLDAVSIGVNTTGLHTTQERLSISSTERIWRLLQRILEN